MTPAQIESASAGLHDLAIILTKLFPQYSVAIGLAVAILKMEARKLAAGIEAGSIVSDGRGGYVPKTNSRVMPDGSLRNYDPSIDG